KTVDTQIPATGETVPGDPQPGDLKAYSEKKWPNPFLDPTASGRSAMGTRIGMRGPLFCFNVCSTGSAVFFRSVG
ncbi:hypothetical protein, partial [Bifidobacterium longum]|uniref:hypothetical protein n=1 Tax=Bifidobacterium longum TaxID=216816 RepID=UPI0018E2E76C